MKLWRISDFADLSGEGGRLYEGRWNRGGRSLVYTAETSALAMLEQLVYLARRGLPRPYQMLEIEAPQDTAILHYDGNLPSKDVERSRAWGEAWLETARTPLARVPSAIAPDAFNLLINPAHLDAKSIRITRTARYPWDARLFSDR